MKLAIIVAEFNKGMTERMLKQAEATAAEHNCETNVTWVPGVYDMPVVIKKKIQENDAVVLLGVVKKGLTEHDRVVAENTARVAADLAVEYGKPVTLGVIGPGAKLCDAEDRLEEYAFRAVEAAVKLAQVL